ncbi:mini-chromosome maintenance complex-binding protein [Anopheles ziemanni]|uniref:mini-chromosome maintenance complex-binding protein n=1 Tax=Anopheles coustani TaxID=139045 RepID=UPI002659CF26|nr:mini-chromosome maintenance complex-binding protein [Anopheles coustani]XP_058173510.1 mini-chromosome maintenance complex-binding protein [Anopheles ziemanni]
MDMKFEKRSAPVWTPEFFLANESVCLEQLTDGATWRSIPLLNCTENSQHLPDGSLVRFRGMVQDMQDPECYLEGYDVRSKSDGSVVRRQNGKFRDILVYNEATEVVDGSSTANGTFGERRSMFVISIPGQNPWASACERELNGGNLSRTEQPVTDSSEEQRSSVKRAHEDEMEVDGASGITGSTDTSCTSVPATNGVKKIATTPAHPAGTSSLLSVDYLLNSPITDRPSKACLVKLYSNYDDWTLNTLVEVVGFLSIDPALDGSGDRIEEDDFTDDVTEHQATNPPPSLIPRLHVIGVRKLSHTNPLMHYHPVDLAEVDHAEAELGNACKDLHNLFTQCLFGDRVAADYLLCHLVSSVYIRDEVESRGQFSLNLSNIPAEVLPSYTQSLYELLELLLPASHYFPMTLENMNTVQFVPRKDYTTNKLTSGLLQLAPHTHLVLDETRLEAGKLESAGVEAVQNVSHLIKSQRLRYNFHYYQLEFNADVPVLVLSEGRSMLPSNCYLPLIPDLDAIKLIDETIKAGRHYIAPKLPTIRRFLTAARIQEFDMKTLDPTIVQEDFVRMRTADSSISMDDLHALFVLARLLGLSQGRKALRREEWERAKELEGERRKRLEMFAKRTSEP